MLKKTDMIIVGAGLSGLITAWRCLDLNAEMSIDIIEKSDHIAGDHTWSFNLADIAPDLRQWLKPFIAHRWENYDVKFPKRERKLDITYCTGNSETLRACVQPYLNSGRLRVRLNTSVETTSADHVVLEDGTTLTATCVLDARGFVAHEDVFLGYQKFVGHLIQTCEPHGVQRPVIMDATVEQFDGYRFVYCLPFSETELLVEDTYYSDGSNVDGSKIDIRIEDYIKTNLGVGKFEMLRRETGVLPITLAVTPEYGTDVSGEKSDAVKLGLTGGYYHAVTGYSLPEAVKSANVVCDMIGKNKPNFSGAVLHEMTYHRVDHFHEEKFLRLLNRMLFRAARPEQRYKILERFYGLSEGLIERFYRNRLTKSDKLRILAGKPPVPLFKALSNFSERAFMQRERAKRDQSK